MAEIIQEFMPQVQRRMTAGERRVAQRLRTLLEDDYTCWYDIPFGKQQRYPDFIILHPARGLLFLEVKDWKPSTLKKISKETVTLQTSSGLKTEPNPFVQVREHVFAAIHLLQKDPLLQQADSKHKGKLVAPYGWGVVFTNITRAQIEKAIPEEHREALLPDHLMMYQNEMTENVDAEDFQQRLWSMFKYRFIEKLTLPQMDRIRWHLFPEVRINLPAQGLLLDETNDAQMENGITDIVRVMDLQQEQLARSLGEGHRVIHGVAGSGKTLILGYRAQALAPLAKERHKPILILCYNTSLAAKLRSIMAAKKLSETVHVHHFHEWCGKQLKAYHVDLIKSDAPYWEREVLTVIEGVEKNHIPRAQYSAVLIDEGHDFEAEWLKLVVQMVDPETNALLLLYDDAQSIYKKKSSLGFTLSSVGIQAQGRTSILRLNYRNTREILDFAYRFAKEIYTEHTSAEEGALVEPEAAGLHGPIPSVHMMTQWQQEVEHCVTIIQKWQKQGVPWRDIAIIYVAGYQGKAISQQCRRMNMPCLWMASKNYKSAYDPAINRVTILSIQSSKGLEFPYVVLVGVGQLQNQEPSQDARLLYVGMTRAQQELHICGSQQTALCERLVTLVS